MNLREALQVLVGPELVKLAQEPVEKPHGSPAIQAKVRAVIEKKHPELVVKEAAPKKEKRRPWNVANHRTGKRPMSVSTMLKKEKDGTLQMKLGAFQDPEFLRALLKIAQLYGSPVPFADASDRGAAPRGKARPDHIPSREDVDEQTPRREDGRNFAATELAPGTSLSNVAATNLPQERTA